MYVKTDTENYIIFFSDVFDPRWDSYRYCHFGSEWT